MNKLLKYGFLVVFAALVLWGGWSLLHPSEEQSTGAFLVVIDPGHGDTDPGAMVGETMEKDINLAVALLVREQLERQPDITVSMTRQDDTFLSLTERAELANQSGADLFVSIHANALEDNDSYSGIFTFYHPDKSEDRALAAKLQKAVTAACGGVDRGVRSADYAVLRETEMDAVLIETGFLTCPDELVRLMDPDYQAQLAQGIAEGILACR